MSRRILKSYRSFIDLINPIPINYGMEQKWMLQIFSLYNPRLSTFLKREKYKFPPHLVNVQWPRYTLPHDEFDLLPTWASYSLLLDQIERRVALNRTWLSRRRPERMKVGGGGLSATGSQTGDRNVHYSIPTKWGRQSGLIK